MFSDFKICCDYIVMIIFFVQYFSARLLSVKVASGSRMVASATDVISKMLFLYCFYCFEL
jgi:intracellular septation protein A